MVDVINGVHKRHPSVMFYLLGVGFYSLDLEQMKQKIEEFGLQNYNQHRNGRNLRKYCKDETIDYNWVMELIMKTD